MLCIEETQQLHFNDNLWTVLDSFLWDSETKAQNDGLKNILTLRTCRVERFDHLPGVFGHHEIRDLDLQDA
jgi:hypothetical protein